MDARKTSYGEKEVLEMIRDVGEIYATKGRQVLHLDLRKDHPDTATVAELLLGPKGNLRAPALRRGRTLIVGFDESTYRKLLR